MRYAICLLISAGTLFAGGCATSVPNFCDGYQTIYLTGEDLEVISDRLAEGVLVNNTLYDELRCGT